MLLKIEPRNPLPLGSPPPHFCRYCYHFLYCEIIYYENPTGNGFSIIFGSSRLSGRSSLGSTLSLCLESKELWAREGVLVCAGCRPHHSCASLRQFRSLVTYEVMTSPQKRHPGVDVFFILFFLNRNTNHVLMAIEWIKSFPLVTIIFVEFVGFFGFFFLFFFVRAAPTAHGNSLARGQYGAAAASLHHSHSSVDLSCICGLRFVAHGNSRSLT